MIGEVTILGAPRIAGARLGLARSWTNPIVGRPGLHLLPTSGRHGGRSIDADGSFDRWMELAGWDFERKAFRGTDGPAATWLIDFPRFPPGTSRPLGDNSGRSSPWIGLPWTGFSRFCSLRDPAARELEQIFAIGKMHESFNLPRFAGRTAADILAVREEGWFSFKAGGTAVITAELSGFFEAYIERTAFIRLVRRDIVAQAISCEKAIQTGRFHWREPVNRRAVYDAPAIAKSIRIIAQGVDRITAYLEKAGRPWRTLVYEAFSGEDFTPAVAVCDALAVPRRVDRQATPYRPVKRIGNAANLEWAARFGEDMDCATKEYVRRYSAAIQPRPADDSGRQAGASEGPP